MNDLEEIFNNDNEFNFNEDEEQVSFKGLENLVAIPMDMSTELISEWYKKGKLKLDPIFQRRYVWDDTRKSAYIESLILGIPIPSILLADDKKQNKYISIDGKQRLNAIISFIADENNGKGFKLKNLQVLKELEGFTYIKLKNDGSKLEHLSRFQDAIVKGSIIKNYTEEQLYFIFNRLNTGSVPLSTQELRQSLYPGEFLNYINLFSLENENLKRVLGIRNPDKRMKDVELVVRYFSFKFFKEKYPNNLNAFFNNTCLYFNESWEANANLIKNECEELNNSISFIYEHFEDDSFRAFLYDEKLGIYKYGPTNRPMFDLLSVVFSNPENRNKVQEKQINLKKFVEDLFQTNENFYDGFLPTTHSKEKIEKRFSEFLNAFNNL